MTDTVSFLTGDEPPQSLSVTKAALYGGGVFRGMLDIGSSSTSAGADVEPVPLPETAVELVPFFEILEGRFGELKTEEWPEEAWESLARLADKHDGGEARAVVKAKICIGNDSLVERTAVDAAFALQRGLFDKASRALSAEVKESLGSYLERLRTYTKTNAFDWPCDSVIMHEMSCHNGCSDFLCVSYCLNSVRCAIDGDDFDPRDPFHAVFQDGVDEIDPLAGAGAGCPEHPQPCLDHRRQMLEQSLSLSGTYKKSRPKFLK